jgi:RHS repeat-associated protein
MASSARQEEGAAGGQSQSTLIQPPNISLPKGGGAIRGMGEKFAANPVTGTGSMSVPIATSPGRGGFGPQLSLSYDSGAGNGPFGFGWSLSLPAITRKTAKGLPRYFDWSSDPADADVFILSGAEDLVPVYRQVADGSWQKDADGHFVIHDDTIDGYRVRRYRPRIEGLFARIERWQWIPTGGDPRPQTEQRADVHWRSISKDNILTIYGADPNSRIADPEQPERIFSWLICESRDDKGNGIRYLYKAEDGTYTPRPGQLNPFLQAHQRNRGAANDPRRTAQRYLHRILYGNRAPLLDAQGQRPRRLKDLPSPPSDTADDWLFEVRFDYGELNEADPTVSPEQPWFYRPDAFSSYQSGFEVRTCRRCERVLMLHHIPDQPASGSRAAQTGYEGVVRSTDFTYDDELDPSLASKPIYSFLQQVVQSGWKQENGTTTRRSLPPVEFLYSQPELGTTVEEVDPSSIENLPVGLDGSGYRWVDLHGEGLPGILTEQAGQWYYKRNLSPISQTLRADHKVDVATFAPLELVASRPNASLATGAQILDLAGDGLPDVVSFSGPAPGLYEHDEAEGWQPFRSFRQLPNVDFSDPNLRFIDLDGDGHADLLISEGDVFVWHGSLEEEGFDAARHVALPWDEEKGPRVVFADGTESIHLADISGDGLADVVRIRGGLQGREVAYWPNLGYGRFGAKVSMDNAPLFDHPELFDPKRLLLADIDGSGTTDLIYMHQEGVRLYFNQAGNGWSEAVPLKVFPPIHSAAQVTTVDLLGNGTACLVWSSPLTGDSGRQMRYVPLMAGGKPHLLTSSVNNLGAETRVRYCSSLRFYLEDKYAGKPWITRLPFPVQVVERVETIDHISRNRFVSRYAYHHGYFDGEEREFRGFGMVEQWDTEQFAALAAGNVPADNIASASHVPPVHTKTWFHTGVYLNSDHVSDYFAGLLNATDQGEYIRESGLIDNEARALLLPDTELPAGLSLEEEREACRALKGSMLRQEVYADDAGPSATPDQIKRARTPYTVSEQNFTVEKLQSQGLNRHAVFFTHPREALSYHYERIANDPRVQHAFTLEVDQFGNVLKQAAVGYGRRQPDGSLPTDADRDKQRLMHITVTENSVTNPIPLLPGQTSDQYRAPLPAESTTWELRRAKQQKRSDREPQLLKFADFQNLTTQASRPGYEIPYEDYTFSEADTRVANQQANAEDYFRRPIEQLRTYFRPNDLGVAAGDVNQLLPLEKLESLALPGESYKLAFTPGLVDQVFQRPRVGQPAEALLPSVDRAQVLGGKGGDQGGYVDLDGNGRWWLPSGRSFFSSSPADSAAAERAEARAHFHLPRRIRDPFDQHAFVVHDGHDLLMVETSDALANLVTVERNDYRVLQPTLVSDPNRNQTEVAFDAMGMVVGTAVKGKPQPAQEEGDNLTGFASDLIQGQIDAFLASPVQAAADPKRTEATAATRGLLTGATPGLRTGATTRIVYDLDRYRRLGEPAMAATIARETHVSDESGTPSRLQVSLSYSDGFGREIQKKIQAEPGPLELNNPRAASVNPRWVGSGWTVFNNKGKPVRQYEPFFSATHGFEFGVIKGVSPVLFYDSAERVIATLHPNHTYEKVRFDPWQQTTYDVNDTCAARNAQTGDPRTDPDIAGFVAEYFKTQPATWQTWHDQRQSIGGALGKEEQRAAQRAAAHADTPTTAHFDSLGRPFLTVARNRVVCVGHALDGTEESFATRVELDIEGNQRAVLEERQLPVNHLPTRSIEQRIVMRYAYDMLGSRTHQLSMEAGARWMLNDVAGKPIRAWDSRGHNFTTSYDALRRPTRQYVRGTFSNPNPLQPNSDLRTLNPGDPLGLLVDEITYGEPPLNASAAEEEKAQQLNLRTRVLRHRDSAGEATNARLNATGMPVEAYDFKGNLLHSTRCLVSNYKEIPDWLLNPQLDAELFEASTRYDALNRPIQSVAPRSSLGRGKFNVTQPIFNEANLLERVDVWLERATAPAALLDPSNLAPSPVGVANIDYDAKGQRQRIDYKNGASTVYSYDPLTFRLNQLLTKRKAADFPDDDPQVVDPNWPGKQVQNLHYTYDPAGNITHIKDDAQQAIYFKNKYIEPSNDYVYDALYRLIQAEGREHLGQGGAPIPHTYNDARRVGILSANPPGRFAPNDRSAMGRYTERYVYDAVGNFLQMQHARSDAAVPGWTRRYGYGEDSLIEPAKFSNRLSTTTVGTQPDEVYAHDAHGNMLGMPQLAEMQWDYKDQLRLTRGQRVNDDDLDGVEHEGERTFYVYDAAGQRIRKVCEKALGLVEERIYLGGFEIFRKHNGPISAINLTLERETLHVMDDKQRVALVETRTFPRTLDPRDPLLLIRYQFGNHLGSASLELDEQAQIISYEEYAPYGSSTYQAVRSRTEAAKRYRYTGKERDEESGLYYHGARYYAAWIGRWTSTDPAGGVLSASSRDGSTALICSSLYAYVGGRVIIANDPDGNALNLVAGAIGAGIGFIVGFGINAAIQLRSEEKFSLKSAIATGVGGAVSGGIGGLTMGASLVAQGGAGGLALGFGVGGAGASVAGGAVTRQILGEKQTAEAASTDAIVGLVTFGLGKGISAALSKSASSQMSAAIRELEKETLEASKQAAVIQNVSQAASSVAKDDAKLAVSTAVAKTQDSVEKTLAKPAAMTTSAPTPSRVAGAVSPSSKNAPTSTLTPKYDISQNPNNVDWRGGGVEKRFQKAIDEAFNRTGVEKEAFFETKWVKTEYGKTVPVEWKAPGGAEVSIDVAHKLPAPDIPHIGWQGPGKGAPSGHVFVDETPFGRAGVK